MSELKSLQRLLVVQAIYEISLNPERKKIETQKILMDILQNLNVHNKLNKSNLNFASNLLKGVISNNNKILDILHNSMHEKEQLKKSDNMLIAIFKPAIYELLFDQNLSKNVVISEYLAIADRFLIKKETGFLNGVLDNLKY
tara:strand:- start:799 stop:1224 length:426 start_codon:yes stop_codon:yes gene_type:complete